MSELLTTEAVAVPVQRYANVYWKGSGSHHVVEDPEGEYVKFEDYEALQAELSMAHDQIRSLQRRLSPRTEPIRTNVREG